MSLLEARAALVTGAGCWAVHRRRAKLPAPPSAQRNADVHIDLGNTVHVDAWAADQTTTVNYRGARWQARLDAAQSAPAAQPLPSEDGVLMLDTVTITSGKTEDKVINEIGRAHV